LKWRKSWEIEEMVSESRMNDALCVQIYVQILMKNRCFVTVNDIVNNFVVNNMIIGVSVDPCLSF